MTKVSVFHYIKLFMRSALFVATLLWYIYTRSTNGEVSLQQLGNGETWIVLVIVWVVFCFEMIMRMFPSPLESNGCQKQFGRNYIPSGQTEAKIDDNHATVLVLLVWIVLNGIIGGLYMGGLIDQGILLLISLVFSICDIICILFFCPFQSWFLKNKCCSTCRIYNWDYAMMFTPLFFIPGIYTWSLLMLSVLLLVRWEITVWKCPERFAENTNEYLACKNCNEKLCAHKKQLARLWTQIKIEKKKYETRILNAISEHRKRSRPEN
ncbi:MAG: hypothetical protein IJT05_09690 [Lachnospiraceae bacterium]|nr:hypothetical protein [Lachnospiraceae bacterium]